MSTVAISHSVTAHAEFAKRAANGFYEFLKPHFRSESSLVNEAARPLGVFTGRKLGQWRETPKLPCIFRPQ